MRIYSSELAHHYQSYTFGYTNYGELEEGDKLELVYNAGFLPYSGSPDAKNTLYMTRSARVVVPAFDLSSENRRIAKKFDGQFRRERISKWRFNADEKFISFCLEYFAKKHGAGAMPRERLLFILQSPFVSDVVVYEQDGKPVAAVLEMREGKMGHYWFSFYDLSLTQQSLGMWLMLDGVRQAKEDGLKHYYLGTVYGQKALYKTNFEPLEWWDGENWSSDMQHLRERGRTDEERVISRTDVRKEKLKLF